MKYKFVGKDLPKEYENRQEPMLHFGESWLLAEGEGWVARIETCGEIRAYKDGSRISAYDLGIEYKTDEELNRAEKSKELEIMNNNWYELQFFAETEHGLFYLDLTSDLVAYSFDECIEQFGNLMADERWCADLVAEVKKVRAEYE